MKLSIVIPVYNNEKYLAECFESLLRASAVAGKALMMGMEILVADNGSSDDSVEIIKDYERDVRWKKMGVDFKAFVVKKRGAAAARNAAIARARGEYFWCVDADDEVTEESLMRILERIQTGVDVLCLTVKKVFLNGTYSKLVAPEPGKDFVSKFIRYGFGPWQLVMRREFWKKTRLEYPEGIIHEDIGLLSSLVLYTESFASENTVCYLYYQRKNSVLNHVDWDGHERDIFPALEGLRQRFLAAGEYEKYREELEYFYVWNLLDDAAPVFMAGKKVKDMRVQAEAEAGMKQIRECLGRYFPKWRKNRFLREKGIKTRLRMIWRYRG